MIARQGARRMGHEMDTAGQPDTHFVPVADQADLERLLATCGENPVVLFKHETGCPISVHAYWEIAAVPYEVSLIDVERQHALSREVANRLGVRHESPQVIVVRDGRPIYDASHWDITREDVTRAVVGPV